MVVVTSIFRVVLCPPPPAIVYVHCPTPTDVTVNEAPLGGAMLAIPLHEFV
ncbi:MAG: hypothetical protein ACREM8_07275 [Vulcanimicrobiaceae bacterium]